MDIFEVSVTGFKRFRHRSILKTNGKMVAIVGPNEAGKTSLLAALQYLGNDDEIPVYLLSRGLEPAALEISGTYLLDDLDRDAAGLTTQSWFKVTKKATGKREFVVLPKSPERDLSQRGALGLSIKAALALRHVESGLEDDDDVEDLISSVYDTLFSSKETLSEDKIDETEELVNKITPFIKPRDAAAIRRLEDDCGAWMANETSEAPNDYAVRILRERLPGFLIFGEDERALKADYDLNSLSTEIPIALENLCDVAQLDMHEVIGAYQAGDTAKLTTLEHKASQILETKFNESWKQSGVHVSVRIQGDVFLVQVKNEKFEFTSLAERSDGLRQFVALQSFATANWSNKPILLIDEAEQKLHYDAQADLVQMLARQNVASKVIYTTHSAGCLPEDLGNGVRFVKPRSEDETRSEIVNKFWEEKKSGFAPLLFGMGASTLAFFPTRNAVVVEGPTDMLLMPSMIREALGQAVLGFQIVPGLAEADKSTMLPTIGQKPGVLYIVDGDEAGQKMALSLNAAGVSRAKTQSAA